jgi:beta propeller domain-containing protein
MVHRGRVVVVLLTLLAVAAAPAAARVRPRAFASCQGLVAYAEDHFAVTHGVPSRPIVEVAPSAPVARPQAPEAATPTGAAQDGAGTTYSTTNNQEEGVDEPDIVKTDGRTIFTIAGTRLVAVDARGPRLAGSLDLGPAATGAQLLLRGSRLIVISSGGPVVAPLEGGGPAIAPLPPIRFSPRTIVTEVDVHDPAAMKVARTLSIDGSYVDARQNGSTARVVISSAPRAIAEASARDEARGWVPARRFHSALTGRRYVRPAAGCREVRRPAQFSGLGMLTILTIDLDRGLWAADSDAMMADAQVVYGSPASLYVATQRWLDPQTAAARLPAGQTTVIHRFDVSDPDRTTFAASGAVDGYLLDQFSLSEYQGRLRVATTSRPVWWDAGSPPPQSDNAVTVLQQHGGTLEQVGRVAGIGRGESIFSVRFLGDVGYVVTFRQVDPLFIVDLRSPAAPKVAGSLEVPGVSTYLHPVGGGRLLGVGHDGSGLQLSLFDVADPAAPKLVARTTLDSSSEAEYDHHAFLYWPATRLAVLPIGTGAAGFRIDPGGLAGVGRIGAADQAPVRRALVIGDRLFTVSGTGVLASDLGTLARQAFVAFG